jgi:hypothetical protein
MSAEDELRNFAESCHMLGLATNNPGWHTVAGRLPRQVMSGRTEEAPNELTAENCQNFGRIAA